MPSPTLPIGSRGRVAGEASLLAGAVFLLYLLTMAPTVIWGDSGIYQTWAAQGMLYQGAMGHPLWVFLAHLLCYLPGAEPAFWSNMLSVLSATLAVVAAFLALHELGISRPAAWGGALALALSHAFWLHAVITEVYTLYMALLLWAIWAVLAWLRRQSLPHLALAFSLWGLSFGNHWMALTAAPAFLLVPWLVKSRRGAAVGVALLACGIGLAAPIYWAFWGEPVGYTVGELIPSLAHLLNPLTYLRSLPEALLSGGYQFSIAGLLGFPGLYGLWRRQLPAALFLTLVAGGQGLFALQHQVPDQYVFYLPVYGVWALAIGCGMQWWMDGKKWAPARPALRAAAVGLLLALLPATFYLVANVSSAVRPFTSRMRQIPFRDTYRYFLWPPKTGYDGARRYALTVLDSLPADGVLLVDWTLYTPLAYEQQVMGVRPDLRVVHLSTLQQPQTVFLAEMQPRPLFLADRFQGMSDLGAIYRAFKSEYYDLAAISAAYDVEPYGLVYALKPKK